METYKDTSKPENKSCYCIGPDKCKDENCPLVKAHREKESSVSKAMEIGSAGGVF